MQIINGLLPRTPPRRAAPAAAAGLGFLPAPLARAPDWAPRAGRAEAGTATAQWAGGPHLRARSAALASVRLPFSCQDKSEMTRVCVAAALLAEEESDFLARSAAGWLAVAFLGFPARRWAVAAAPKRFSLI